MRKPGNHAVWMRVEVKLGGFTGDPRQNTPTKQCVQWSESEIGLSIEFSCY